jgi:DNA-binding transcriptional regulator YiaG
MSGVEFRQLRTSNRLSQKELARILGISERQIQRWESARVVSRLGEYALIGVSTICEHTNAA